MFAPRSRWPHNLQGPVGNENAGPLVEKGGRQSVKEGTEI